MVSHEKQSPVRFGPGIFIAATVVSLLATPILAADDQGRFAVDGVGRQPCSVLVEAVRSENREQIIAFASWTDGFLTGANVYGLDTFDITPWQPIELLQAKLRQYCEANPDVAVINALGRLASVLEPDRLAEADELVSVRNDGQGVFIYGAMLDRVRQALAEAGHPAPSEGFDAKFADALVTYQAANDLPQTGLPDLATLNSLFP
ncbi:Putative peptidoglycan binding domain-containing protein [Poseidonocella pacifica]|uniref:Putative peptidoglycan binding domain-containing protein n=1 Tax=Poseidonocella pacifica TaxID=871651 RepID=A0A1I0WIP5_9RHOB|nr:peptidoglycan-binding domain-containing protein [Poseidonocella pacifica]SFA87873.1 Putative peptidoglycan binding domain-containing protein [Poseidonocella pacifica]